MDLEAHHGPFPIEAAREAFLREEPWQPVRRLLERLGAARDWGEVIVASIGAEKSATEVRAALAMGADRGILVKHDGPLDPVVVSDVLQKICEREKPDLVIVDLRMPKMSGLEFCKRVRADPEISGTPLLVVPLGTANLMGKHLGIDWHARGFEESVMAAVRRGQVVHLDAARQRLIVIE